MTLISLTDGDRVILKDGKVATEQECCCCCVVIEALPLAVGFTQNVWDNCYSGVWETIQARLQDAGYIVTIKLLEGADPNGVPLVNPLMEITSSCCGNCENIIDALDEAFANNGAITGQAAGSWVDIQSFEVFNTPCGPIQFGSLGFTGCCGQICLAGSGDCLQDNIVSVNGEGDNASQWIPVCNPLP